MSRLIRKALAPVPFLVVVLVSGCLTPLGPGAEPVATPPPGVVEASRDEVRDALLSLLPEHGFEVVLEERPGRGPWRLFARGPAEERFLSLVGRRGRVQELEARLTVAASGRTHLDLEGRVWVYAGEAPAPGAEEGPAATSSPWQDEAPLEALRAALAQRLQ